MLSISGVKRFWTVLPVCFAVFFMTFSGCKKSSSGNSRDDFSGYGTLPYLSKTTHPELSKEYSMLVEDRQAPWHLVQKDEHPHKNMAVKLRNLLSESKSEKILKETNFLVEKDEFKFDHAVYSKIRTMAETKDNKVKNELIQKAIQLPNCIFRYDCTKGYTDKSVFVDRVWAAARLQELAAANSLYNTRSGLSMLDGKRAGSSDASINPALDEAIVAVRTIFTLADRLGQVKQLRARLTAASIRWEACLVLEALVEDPRCNRQTLIRLRNIVQETLAHWPSDAKMWIGERTYGLYHYEAIRAGELFNVLAQEDEDRFRKEGVLDILREADDDRFDTDQLYYMKKMRHLISQSRRDFHKRPLLGAKILEELEKLKKDPNYPIIAGELLLVKVNNSLLLQMIDLARMRAWAVALDIATGEKPGENVNPLTGEPFWVVQNKEAVTVHLLPPDEDTKLGSPIGEEAVKFITNQVKRPVVVPKL